MKTSWKLLSAWIATLFSVSSCEEISDIIGNQPCMYGMPTADYNVDLTVTDGSGNPIEGIKVYFGHYPPVDHFTDKDGKLKLELKRVSFPSAKLEDVDGPANGGEFEELILDYDDFKLDLIRENKDKKDSWYRGEYNAKAEVCLKKKQ